VSDTASPAALAVQDATEIVVVAEVVQAARYLGVQHLPDADRLVTGRVWPGGHGWVAEIGEGGNVHALDDMCDSMIQAIKAVDAEIRRLRDATVTALRDGGEQAAQLATTREHWEPPVLKVTAEISQQQPWLVQLPA
jgi:hypothetical protein